MAPRKADVLRDRGGENLRAHLIAAAARLIAQGGAAGLSVRDIAGEAGVADGVLYNYFADKEDLLAHALLAHVGGVMASAPRLLPPAGTGTVADNLCIFFERAVALLSRVTPAFAGLVSQPNVLSRFHAMAGGDAAFAGAPAGHGAHPGHGAGDGGDRDGAGGGRGLGELLTRYLEAEQALGRIDAAADIDAVTMLLVGAVHGQVLPRVLFSPPGTAVSKAPDMAERLAGAIIAGIGPA